MGGLELPWFSPDYGSGTIHIQGPRRTELGRWKYGIAATFSTYWERFPDRADQVDALHRALVTHDEARRRWHSPPEAERAAAGRRRRRTATADLDAARATLTDFFHEGLEALEGQFISPYEERTWMHLRGRGLPLAGLTVCERCALVFRGRSNARFCAHCRRRPVRITLHPVCEGGWHLDFFVGPRFFNSERDVRVRYTARCEACAESFLTDSPTAQLCRNCGGGAGRTRRSRGSGRQLGRKRYRFAHVDGEDDFSVGLAYGKEGRQVSLKTSTGVIETTNAEYAHLLDANHQLITLPPLAH